MCRCKDWKGKVTWALDNQGITNRWPKTSWMSQLDWIKQSDRDVYAYIAHLKPLLAARWGVNWVEGHVEDLLYVGVGFA
jgi:hypothetical protein